MRNLFHTFRLNLGLKRIFVYHPVASKVLTLAKPGRLRLPKVTLEEFIGRPPPPILFQQLSAPPMGTSATDLVPLCTIAATLQPRRILEIGCNFGSGTVNLARVCPQARLVTYDINPKAGAFIGAAEPTIRERIELRVVSFPSDADRLRREDPYDFIYVDGDHGFAGAHADTVLSLERLAPGGVIAWHDYDHQGHEWIDGTNMVPEVLDEFAGKIPIRHLAGTMLAVWRRPAA